MYEVIPAINITKPRLVIAMESGRNNHSQMEDPEGTVVVLPSAMFQKLYR